MEMTNEQIITAIELLVKDHQSRIRIHRADGIVNQLNGVIQDYQHSAELALSAAADFREEVLRWFCGLRIVADSVANAGTHSEKNARLRGLTEILDSASEKLRKMHFDITLGSAWPDVFRTDYPTRHFLERIRELESQVKAYEAELCERARPNTVVPAGMQLNMEPPPF